MAQRSSSSRYERFLASGNRYLEKNNLEDAERTFSSAVREVYLLRNKLYETAIALKGLGLVYKARGKIHKSGEDLVKASGLLTASLNRLRECNSENESKRTVEEDLKPEIGSLEEEIRNVHTMFIDEILQSQQNDSKSDFRKRENYKQTLQTIRDSCQSKISAFDKMPELDPDARDINVESERIEQTQQLYKFISKSMKDLITSMADDCIKVMSSPPCKFSILGLGSTAREEATPYSDLEFCILVETNTDSVMQYFTDFTNLLHLKVVELGETILPSLGIKSLNDYYSGNKGENWFYDDGPRGFSFDGAMPWASKTPKGRDKTLKKPWVQSLIKTPRDMFGLLSEESIFKEGYHLADVLSNPSLIYGDDSLFKDYSKLMREYFEKTVNNCNSAKVNFKSTYHINAMSWKERILHELVEVNKKYHNFLADYIRRPGESYEVKTNIYRFASLVIQYVGKYFDVQCPSSWETIRKLESAKFVSPGGAHNLRTVLGIAAELRLRTYLSNHCQSEYFKTNFQDLLCLLQRFFCTIIPLEEALKKLSDASGLPEVMKTELYQNIPKIKAQMYLQFGEYDKAEEILERMFVNTQEDGIAEMLGISLYLQNKLLEALEYFRKAIEISEPKYQRDQNSFSIGESFGNSYLNYSVVLHDLGKIEEAISYGNKALEIRYSMLEKNSTATCQIINMLNVADAHYNLGKFHIESFLSGNKRHGTIGLHHLQHAHDISNILNNKYNTAFRYDLGVFFFQMRYYLKKERWEKAEKILSDALETLYKRRKYDLFTEVETEMLTMLGIFALYTRDLEKARFGFTRAYEISSHIHGENDHDSLVLSLKNLGELSEVEKKFEEAESFYTQAKEMSIRIHGEGSDNEFLKIHREGTEMIAWRINKSYRQLLEEEWLPPFIRLFLLHLNTY